MLPEEALLLSLAAVLDEDELPLPNRPLHQPPPELPELLPVPELPSVLLPVLPSVPVLLPSVRKLRL